MKKPNRQRQMAKQRRQAKRRQRTATRPVPALDDGSPEAAWMRVPASKGGPGGGAGGMARHGLVLLGTGRIDDARRCFQEAQRKAPREPELRAYIAACSMMEGDFSGDVWPTVRHVHQGQLAKYRQPVWDGSAHPDGRLFIWEPLSGFGDTFQLCRLWTKAKSGFRGRVVCGIPAGMTRLLSSVEGPDELLEPPFDRATFDFHCPIDQLPAIPGCELTGETFGTVPYVRADPELVAKWAPTFADKRKLHIGLHWQSDQSHLGGKYRRVSFSEFKDILCVEHVQFYSLQYGGQEEVAKFPEVTDLGNIDDPASRFMETAAVMQNLDLMICVDSGPGHLSGSLGVPTWLLLDVSHDPRWCFGREQTPFYPRHRLYRAANIGDFEKLLYSVGDVLDGFVRKTLAYRGIVT